MVMKLESVVPFGRSLDEYRQMFALSDDDLERTILGVADGPASFNTEMTGLGKRVVSVDPLYAFPGGDIEKQFAAVLDNIIAQVQSSPDDWVWSYHRSPERLRENRVSVLGKFVSDYDSGKTEGRYRVGELPRLDFVDDQFDLALCSHFLFLYSDQYSYEFHQASVYEMLRVAREVRIFPLLSLMLERSQHLQPLVDDLISQGCSVSVRRVDYELQKGANEMLQITRSA